MRLLTFIRQHDQYLAERIDTSYAHVQPALEWWTVGFLGARHRRTLGFCTPSFQLVEIHQDIFNCRSYSDGHTHQFFDTLRHEMAHAIDYIVRGTSDHGPHWRAVARNVGANPSAIASIPQGVSYPTAATHKRRVGVVCDKCGLTWTPRRGIRKYNTTGMVYTHKICGGRVRRVDEIR